MKVEESLLVKMFGFPATLIHGDTAVLDRWLWLRKHLPETCNGEKLVDIGCGTGAFSIGAALRGYEVLGLSWSARNQEVAGYRARLCNARSAAFDVPRRAAARHAAGSDRELRRGHLLRDHRAHH